MDGKDEKTPQRPKKSLSAPPDIPRKRRIIDVTDSDDDAPTEEQLIELVGDAEDEEDFSEFWGQYIRDYTSHQPHGLTLDQFNATQNNNEDDADDEMDEKAEPEGKRASTPEAEASQSLVSLADQLGPHLPLHPGQLEQEEAEREEHVCPGMGCGCGCMICRVE